ncbi:hypothetical protein QE152_g13816 [Popillia japonica]|uniref:Uncharacterized protein n=1 Tax=Popillia japonica TaxID=7064 RepID=A0AAW1LBU8_POPJA
MNTFITITFLLTLLALVNLATSFPTTPLGESPVKLANEATTAKTDVTTGSAALTTSTTEESREKREARSFRLSYELYFPINTVTHASLSA